MMIIIIQQDCSFITNVQPVCLYPDPEDAARLTEMSVTSGEPLAAILGRNVATNTFLIRRARTGNLGSLEHSLLSASLLKKETGIRRLCQWDWFLPHKVLWAKNIYCGRLDKNG